MTDWFTCQDYYKTHRQHNIPCALLVEFEAHPRLLIRLLQSATYRIAE